VQALPVYERRCPVWDEATRTRARALLAGKATWLFSSGEAAGHLRQLLPDAAWRDVPALATHPRIAQALATLGWGTVHTVRPDPEAVLGALAAV
jgi:uroporphyrinogen-III synthase